MNYVTHYSEFRKFRPMTNRERLRYIALELLSRLPKKNGNDEDSHVVFMAFHFLFVDNEQLFKDLLEVLATEYTFLTVSDAIDQLRDGRLTGKNLCFTCDDGFMSCKRAGEIMTEYGASCCFFLCPSFINNRSEEAVADVNMTRLGGPPIEFLTWNDVDALLSSGHEIGNHTYSHVNLGSTNDETGGSEIESAHEILDKQCGPMKHFACPYGYPSSYSEHSLNTVNNLGYQSFFTTTRGNHSSLDGGNALIFRRQHFEPFWPVNHSHYFIK